jgi:hypothetical protein
VRPIRGAWELLRPNAPENPTEFGHTRVDRAAAAFAAIAVMAPGLTVAILAALTGMSAILLMEWLARALGTLLRDGLRGTETSDAEATG